MRAGCAKRSWPCDLNHRARRSDATAREYPGLFPPPRGGAATINEPVFRRDMNRHPLERRTAALGDQQVATPRTVRPDGSRRARRRTSPGDVNAHRDRGGHRTRPQPGLPIGIEFSPPPGGTPDEIQGGTDESVGPHRVISLRDRDCLVDSVVPSTRRQDDFGRYL